MFRLLAMIFLAMLAFGYASQSLGNTFASAFQVSWVHSHSHKA
jgi:hypothetical protein